MKEWHVALGAVGGFLGPPIIAGLLAPHIGAWAGFFLIGGWALVYVWSWSVRQAKAEVREQEQGEARYLCVVCDITYPLQRSACPVCTRPPDQERRLR